MSDWLVLCEPWWCMEGFVVEAGRYPRRMVGDLTVGREQQVLTTLGWATLLEPSDGVEPTQGPAVFTTGPTA